MMVGLGMLLNLRAGQECWTAGSCEADGAAPCFWCDSGGNWYCCSATKSDVHNASDACGQVEHSDSDDNQHRCRERGGTKIRYTPQRAAMRETALVHEVKRLRAKLPVLVPSPTCAQASWSSTPSSQPGWSRSKPGNAYHPGANQECTKGHFWGQPTTSCEYGVCPAGFTANMDAGQQPSYTDVSLWPSTCPCVSTNAGPMDHEVNLQRADMVQLWRGQRRMTALLAALDRIAKAHNLTYFMCAGTLIGAIRRQGWVLHDDDVDIGFLESDYPAFQRYALKELPDGMWLQDWDSDPLFGQHYNHSHAKLRDLNSMYDLNPGDHRRGWHNGLRVDFFLVGPETIPNPGQIGCWAKSCCATGWGGGPEAADQIETFDIAFEHHMFAAPRLYDEALTAEFGPNWRAMPPLASRKGHEERTVLSAPDRFKHLYPKLYPNNGTRRPK